MTFGDWLRNTRQHLRQSGLRKGGRAAASEFYTGMMLRAFAKMPKRMRTNVFDRDWDVLIVLDACRLDAMQAVAPEYDWIESVDSIRSTGSMSEEWMQQSFRYTDDYPEEMAETGHITWNAYSTFNLNSEEWAYLDEVWKPETGAWSDELGLIPPRELTDRAIDAWRSQRASRLLVHYQQPHTPFRALSEKGIIEPLTNDRVGDKDNQTRLTVWKLLRRGEITHEEAWSAYLDNLRWVLDDIAVLRENLDADRVVITADHGDCFGEWGGIFGHPKGVPVPELVTVPWVPISCRDTCEYEPEVKSEEFESEDNEAAMGRLEALGYV